MSITYPLRRWLQSCLWLCLSLCSLAVVAQPLLQKGEAEVSYGGFKPGRADYLAAETKAKINAIENYIAGQGQSLQAAYDREARTALENNIDDYVLSSSEVRAPVVNKQRDTVKVVLRVKINEARLNDLLRKTSDVADKRRSEKSKIAFVFVARQQQSVTSFQAQSDDASDYAQADDVAYKALTNLASVENTVKSTLLTKGFRVTSSSRMESRSGGVYSKARLVQQYVDDLSIDWLQAERAAEILNNDFFIFGSFEVGIKQKDPVTEQWRISVRANAEMIHLEEAETVAVVGNVQYDALGRNEATAINNALKQAAEQTANELVKQLYASKVY